MIGKYTDWVEWSVTIEDTIGSFIKPNNRIASYLIHTPPLFFSMSYPKLLAVPIAQSRWVADKNPTVYTPKKLKSDGCGHVELLEFRYVAQGSKWSGYHEGYSLYEIHRVFNNLPKDTYERYAQIRGLSEIEISDLVAKHNKNRASFPFFNK